MHISSCYHLNQFENILNERICTRMYDICIHIQMYICKHSVLTEYLISVLSIDNKIHSKDQHSMHGTQTKDKGKPSKNRWNKTSPSV
jgi:hypothetical protein